MGKNKLRNSCLFSSEKEEQLWGMKSQDNQKRKKEIGKKNGR